MDSNTDEKITTEEKDIAKWNKQAKRDLKDEARFLEEMSLLEIAESEANSDETIYLPHGTDSDKVTDIRISMAANPTTFEIRVIRDGDDIYALEGTHRLTAASQLTDVVPVLLVQHLDSPIATDIQVVGNDFARTYADLLGDLVKDFPLPMTVRLKELDS